MIDRAPATADDITRAVTAAGLLRDRLLVLTRLRHLGVHVVEAEHDKRRRAAGRGVCGPQAAGPCMSTRC